MNMFKKNGGFTLVELIVVIAILAILAGVAIPVYSGYIKKANEAADVQAIAAVNTSLAAACAENSIAVTDIANNGVTFDEETDKITVTDTNIAEAVRTAIAADFDTYFTGNNVTLKYFASLQFTNGEFVGVEATN